MKIILGLKPFLVVLIIIVLVINGNSQPSGYLPNRLVIKVNRIPNKSNSPQNGINLLLSGYDYKLVPLMPSKMSTSKDPAVLNLESIFIVDFLTDIDVQKFAYELSKSELVAYVEPYYKAELMEVPNDPLINNQYYLSKVNAYNAHDITIGDTTIVVGIVDTGVDLNHTDLKPNIQYNYKDPINGIDDDYDGYIDNFYGWDIAENDNNPSNPSNNHGTRVAGLTSAVTNNHFGIASVGNKTKLLPIKVANDAGALIGTYEGVLYAADHGCKIINCSWGGKVFSKFGADIIDYAINYRGCLVIAAAGNDKTDEPFYPASYEGVLSVAASNQFDNKWSGSSWGINVDICAPGEGIYSTSNSNGFVTGNGTSYSSPIVAGAAALLMSKFQKFNALQIAQKLRINSDIIDTLPENLYFKRLMGYGRLNVLKALTDTVTPAIRISDINITDLYGQFPQAGDTLNVSCSFTNYLYKTSSTLVKLTSESPYVTFLKSTFALGSLGELESKNNAANPFMVKLSPSTPTNETIRFTIEIVDDAYSDYQHFETLVNTDFVNLSNDQLITSVCSNGKIGFSNKENNLGLGIIYKNQQVLFDAGLLLGTDSKNFVSAVSGVYEFEALTGIDTFLLNESYTASTKFEPKKNIWDAGLIVNQSVTMNPYGFDFPAILYEYEIENPTDEDIVGMRLGLFVDWNLDNEFANMTEFVDDLNLHYTYSNTNNVLFAGVCYLNNAKCNPYAFDLISGGNGGLDITTSFSNEQKWFAMQTKRSVAGNLGDSIDVAGMLSSFPLNIEPYDSIKQGFALILADNYSDLVSHAFQLISEYRFEPVSTIEPNVMNEVIVFPNPANSKITFNAVSGDNLVSATWYNANGNAVFSSGFCGSATIEQNIGHLPNGLYIVRLSMFNTIVYKKVLISK